MLMETDGSGPVKRRRPALSCVECRRRKVKCDRTKPCGPCTRTKSPTCTYRSTHNTNIRSNLSHAQSSAQPSINDSGYSGLNLDIIQNSELDLSRSHNTSPSTLGLLGSDTDRAIRALIDKVQELEARLDSNQTASVPGNSSASARDVTPPATGQFIKSRFYGETHWMNAVEPYEALGERWIRRDAKTNRTEINRSSDLYAMAQECKRMARKIKAARTQLTSLPPDLGPTIPTKEVCDLLVDCYMHTFEGVFRVLHIPTFMREYEQYWENISAAKPSVLVKFLLVCAIGVPFCTDERQPQLRALCTKWVEAGEHWLNGPHEKSRLNLTGLQIQILVLIARQTCCVNGDFVWISIGSLLRVAMHVGLHRDPAHFPKLTPFVAEMRRRLWATVLELTVQSALDMGMPPMISPQDFDTLPPSNIDDDQISEDALRPVDAKPLVQYTRTSVQIALQESLPVRLEITRLINELHPDLSYDDTIRLGTELQTICRRNSHRFRMFLTSNDAITTFQVKVLETFASRFIISLHRPFFTKAATDPRYYYSKKICLDTALAIIAPASDLKPSSVDANEKDDWFRLMTHGVGFVKSIYLYAYATIYSEIGALIQEQQREVEKAPAITDTLTSSLASTATPSSHQSTPWSTTGVPLTLGPQFESYRHVLDAAKEIAATRLKNGEVNPKGMVFVYSAIARINALIAGVDPNEAVLIAARHAMGECSVLMRQAYKDEWGVDIDLSLSPQFDVEHGGRDLPREGDESGHSKSPAFSKSSGFEELEADMDWEALMHDGSMDFGFGLDFGFGSASEGSWGM